MANFPPVLLIPTAVSLIPVVHLELRISPRILEKIGNGLNGTLWAGGKLIHEKKREAKRLMTLSL
jgi:hypothetical protein